MRFQTMWYVRQAKPQISLRIRVVSSEPFQSLEYSTTGKLMTEHHLEFLNLKESCIGSSESTLVKMPHCWKSDIWLPILRYNEAHRRHCVVVFEQDTFILA